LWHVREHGGARALGLLRRRISGYNEAVGTANTADSGYHETLTRFYVRMIEAFLAGHAAGRDAIVDLPLMERALVAAIGDRGLPLRYYSRERLFTEAARRRWVTPDLQALPPTRRAAARPARSLDGFECRLNESSFSVKATPRGAGQKQR
jgi:hypothetical protein